MNNTINEISSQLKHLFEEGRKEMKTEIMTFARIIRVLSGSLYTAAMAAAMVGSLSFTALGVNVQTSYEKLNNGPADFGSGTHSFGGPSESAVITFDYDTSSGQLVATGRVRGTLYWDDFFSSGCARVTFRFRNSADGNLAIRNIDRCGPGGDANNLANQIQVDESFAHPNLSYIRITTAKLSNGQPVGAAFKDVAAPVDRTYSTTMFGGDARFSGTTSCTFFPRFCNTPPATINFSREDELMSGFVCCQLSNFGFNTARLLIDFRTINGSLIERRTIGLNNQGNMLVRELFESGSLFQVRLRVGEATDCCFQNVTSKTFDFNGQTGNFEVRPANAAAVPNEQINYSFTWTVPEPLNWHNLKTLDLLILDDLGTILLLRFDEASNTFSLFNERSGKFGPAFASGSPVQLQTSKAALHLADASVTPVNSVLGSGPNSPSVTLNLPLSFKASAAGRTYRVLVAASDDLGNEDPFAFAGMVTVSQ